MKKMMFIALCLGIVFHHSHAQKDKDAQKAEKSANRDAAKSAREANRAFKDKDYYTAIMEGVDALDGELNKKNAKNIAEILTESYSVLENNSLQIIGQKEAATTQYFGRSSVTDRLIVVEQFSRLTAVQEKLGTLDDGTLTAFGLKRSSFENYGTKLESANTAYLDYATRYCQEQYTKGEAEMAIGTKQSAFRAYFHLNEVAYFLPEFENAAELVKQAKEIATYRILFVDFGTNYVKPPTTAGTASIADRMQGSIEKHRGSKYAPFVKFSVSPFTNDLFLNANNPSSIEAFCKAREVDAVIFGTFETPTVNHADGKPESKEIEAEITVGEKKEIQDGKEVMVPIKQKAKAVRTYYSRANVSKVNGKYFLYDAYQKKYILKDFGMQGEYEYTQTWTMASGDLRVFDEKEQRRFAKEPEPIPEKGSMQLGAISELSKKVEAKTIEALKNIFEGN